MRSLPQVFIATVVCVFAGHGLAGEFPLEQWKAWQEKSARRVPQGGWMQYATPEEAGWSSEKLAEARSCFDSNHLEAEHSLHPAYPFSVFRAKIESEAKVQVVRAWYVYIDAWIEKASSENPAP